MANDWKEVLRQRLSANIKPLKLSDKQKADLLEVETAKAIACTEASADLNIIRDEGSLWAIMQIPDLSPTRRAAMLTEEAERLVQKELEASGQLHKLRAPFRHGTDD